MSAQRFALLDVNPFSSRMASTPLFGSQARMGTTQTILIVARLTDRQKHICDRFVQSDIFLSHGFWRSPVQGRMKLFFETRRSSAWPTG